MNYRSAFVFILSVVIFCGIVRANSSETAHPSVTDEPAVCALSCFMDDEEGLLMPITFIYFINSNFNSNVFPIVRSSIESLNKLHGHELLDGYKLLYAKDCNSYRDKVGQKPLFIVYAAYLKLADFVEMKKKLQGPPLEGLSRPKIFNELVISNESGLSKEQIQDTVQKYLEHTIALWKEQVTVYMKTVAGEALELSWGGDQNNVARAEILRHKANDLQIFFQKSKKSIGIVFCKEEYYK